MVNGQSWNWMVHWTSWPFKWLKLIYGLQRASVALWGREWAGSPLGHICLVIWNSEWPQSVTQNNHSFSQPGLLHCVVVRGGGGGINHVCYQTLFGRWVGCKWDKGGRGRALHAKGPRFNPWHIPLKELGEELERSSCQLRWKVHLFPHPPVTPGSPEGEMKTTPWIGLIPL